MSASLIVLIPVALLGLVAALCFVGCILPTSGLAFTAYRSTTVLGNPNLVAFWPLDDPNNSVQARELEAMPPIPGNYIVDTIAINAPPGLFPDPAVPNVSAAAPGDLLWFQAGIVAGDVLGGNASLKSPCVTVNGGFVSVPFDPRINPPSFTVEAWVTVGWRATDPTAFRVVVDCRTFAGNNVNGFALFANPGNQWVAAIGGGAAGQTTLTGASVVFGSAPVYLAMTYDNPSQTLKLFVNGVLSAPAMPNVPFVPNTATNLFIGSGEPSFPLRPQPTLPPAQTAPLTPFVGKMQDVAVYNAALAGGTMDANDVIFTHYTNGSGSGVDDDDT